MWLLRKPSIGLLWLEFISKEHTHYLLPVFTSPDTAIDFVGDINHEGELISMVHINSVDQVSNLIDSIKERDASAIVLDAPHPDTLTSEDRLIYWNGDDFKQILETIIEISSTHEEKQAISVLNTYLKNKMLHGIK
jgi:hypothetical protein